MTRLKPIPILADYDYFADSSGSIYRWTGKKLKEIPGWIHYSKRKEKSYRRVMLFIDGVRKAYYVQRLVLLAFAGEPKPGELARHGVNGSLDNSPDNLQWGTPYENQVEDRLRDGTYDARGGSREEPIVIPKEIADDLPF